MVNTTNYYQLLGQPFASASLIHPRPVLLTKPSTLVRFERRFLHTLLFKLVVTCRGFAAACCDSLSILVLGARVCYHCGNGRHNA